jgi:hypothetical protein
VAAALSRALEAQGVTTLQDEIQELQQRLRAQLDMLNDELRLRIAHAINEGDHAFLAQWLIVDGVAYDKQQGIALDWELIRPMGASQH